jgi:rhamnosyltransferase
VTQKISIIIPVKNGINTINKCLKAIFKQTLIDQTEVIIIDSGSSDGTLEILREYPVLLYCIPPVDFNHGATRNYGVSLAKGEIIVMTVQDAIPTDQYWLENLTNPFSDTDIMGICGRQMIPHDLDKNPGAWTQTFSSPTFKKVSFSKKELAKMSPREKKTNCGWDNVTAAYRKEAIVKHPFPTTNYSEDINWAYNMLQLNFHLGYEPNAKVFHYHHENFTYRYKRHLIEITQHFNLYGLKPTPFIYKADLIPFYLVINKSVRQKTKWLCYNLRLLLANKSSELIFYLTFLLKGQKGVDQLYYKITKEIPIGTTQ